MSVMRVHKTQNFTVMSNYHFKEKEMSLKAKGLLSMMLSLPDDWNYTISGLVKLSKDGKDSVMAGLAELEKFGYLKRNRTTDSKGRFAGIEYHIFEHPTQDLPIADKPTSVSQNSEESPAGNQPQLRTKELKTKNNKILDESNTKKEIEKKEPSPSISDYDEILSQVSNDELRELYIDYIEMRYNMNSPISKRGLSMLVDRCDRLSNFHTGRAIQLLERAIINGWKNVYIPGDIMEDEPVPNKQLEDRKRMYLSD